MDTIYILRKHGLRDNLIISKSMDYILNCMSYWEHNGDKYTVEATDGVPIDYQIKYEGIPTEYYIEAWENVW